MSQLSLLHSERMRRAADWVSTYRWPLIGLTAACLLIYLPVVSFQFLNWDDSWYIVRNDLIKSWYPSNLYRILTEPVARNFAPLTIGTFLIEHSIWELWPGGYHLTNVALHLVNAVLVFWLVRQVTGSDWLAWGTAALFTVHPVQVEAVAWVSSRKTLLSSTFMLASLICWLKPDRTSRDEGWGMGWLLLGLLSKASVVVLPGIVLAYDILVRRQKFSDSVVRQIVPMFFCVMLIFITMQAQVTIVGGVRDHIGMSKLQLLAIDATLLWRYAGMLLWPQGLCVLYDPPVQGITLMIATSMIGWGLVAYALWRVKDRHPLIAFAGICWLFLFVPVLNLFPLTTLMNDRYLYLPCVPFFAVALAGLQRVLSRLPTTSPSNAPHIATIMLTMLIGAATWQTLTYLPVWQDPVALWQYARQKTPTLTVVHIQWALTMQAEGRFDEAREALMHALHQTSPDELDQQRIKQLLSELPPS